MGVFKEEAHVFENIAKKQTRIFNDAADYGYPYNTKDVPTEVTDVFDVITDLKKLDFKFPYEKNLVRNRQTWGTPSNGGVSVDVIIFWERDEGYDMGTKYTITFNNISHTPSLIDKSANAFISVDVERYSEKS